MTVPICRGRENVFHHSIFWCAFQHHGQSEGVIITRFLFQLKEQLAGFFVVVFFKKQNVFLTLSSTASSTDGDRYGCF